MEAFLCIVLMELQYLLVVSIVVRQSRGTVLLFAAHYDVEACSCFRRRTRLESEMVFEHS